MALSIDDGPDPRYTPPILKTLKDKGARATFFVVGSQAEKHPDIITEIDLQGHGLANHTWTHPQMTKIESGQLKAEVSATNLLISKLTGKQNEYFRPPRGELDQQAAAVLNRAGYTIYHVAGGH